MASSKDATKPPGSGAARRYRPEVEGKRTARPRLHGFSLQDLSWGNQKVLRCVKLPDDTLPGRNATASQDRRKRRAVEDEDEEELREIREKLMAHYKVAVNNIQRASKKNRRYESALALAPAPATGGGNDEKDFDASGEAGTSRPWNLRTRRSACSAPQEGGLQRRSPNTLPTAAEKGYHVGSAAEPKIDPLADARAKFSLTLTKEEIAEDYHLMSEGCPTKKPKRRPLKLQRLLDKLVPGMWLSEITADDYKVAGEK